MNKYNNPRLTNTTIAGSGMKHPVRPHVIIGDPKNGYIQGDLMDANAVKEIAKESVNDIVDSAPEALDTLKELADAIQENGAADLVTKGLLEAGLANKVDLSDMVESDANGHDYIEIGGIKWATMNIGANSVTDTGLYFAWGDTQGYDVSQVGNGAGLKAFGWTDYKYANGTSNPGAAGMTKYNSTDGKDVLELSDDAARENWGGTWRMPTKEELQVLVNATNALWTTNYQGSGMSGYTFTDKTDSSKILFFPGASYCMSGSRYGGNNLDNCSYWTSSIDETTYPIIAAHTISGGVSTSLRIKAFSRYCGRSVRAVLDEENKYATKAEVKQLQSSIVQSDWNLSDSTAIDYIKNKPDISALEARIAALEQAAQS